jgi:uncharacterized cofD-like protein
VTDARVALDPLLEELERTLEGPRVVAVGGGHGLARALEAITDYAGTITAVVGVADDGGSSGRLVPDLGIPPPGDIRRALLALSPEPSLWRDLVDHRFTGSDVEGHSLGNLLIAALAHTLGDFERALDELARVLGARGAVVPVSPVPLVLEAEVEGYTVRGQVAIARSRGRVSSLDVVPADAPATPAALDAVARADQIVLGPGSLYTSVIAPLRVRGFADAINDSQATLVYVCNLTTQDGETLGLSGREHVEALISVGGVRPPDRIVTHGGPLRVPPGLERLELTDGPDGSVIAGDIADEASAWPQHDPARLGAILRRLVG